MINKHFLTPLIFLFITVYSGCTGLLKTETDWSNLSDKKFYFTEFQYIQRDKNNKHASEMMKSFPVKQIMYILSQEYNIEIDMSDYNRFIQTGNSGEIKSEGFIRNEKFFWKSANPDNSNKILIIFGKDYFDETHMSFALQIFSGDKKIKSIQFDFSRMDYFFKQLDFYISKTDEYIEEFDKNNYNTKDFIPGLFLVASNPQKVTETDKKSEIKNQLEEYVKTLDAEQKKAFKHEIIDHIYKICE